MKGRILSDLEEELIATSLLRCKQNSSADKYIVSYKTGGLPLTYMHISKSRKSISKSMQPKRSRVMVSVRRTKAGTSNQQLLAQHKAELKRMNSELKSGLRGSVFKEQTTVNKKVTPALKTLGGLSVAQFRVQKRLLKQACNITLASEKSERTEEMEIRVETHVENQELHFNCVKQLSVGKS